MVRYEISTYLHLTHVLQYANGYFTKTNAPRRISKWAYGWNPFTHYTTTLKELIYMNKAIELNSTVWMLIGFMIFGIISSLIAAIVRKHSTKRTEIPS